MTRGSTLLAFCLSLLLSAICLAPASSAQFLQFSAARQAQGSDVLANGKTVIRLRTGGGAGQICGKLTSLALAGLAPGQVTVKAAKDSAQLIAAGTVLATVDAKMAAASKSTPAGLVGNWAANLKAALSTPYVILECRATMPVPLGEKRTLKWGGTAGTDLTFASLKPDVAALHLDNAKGILYVEGVGLGRGVIEATLDNQQVNIEVEVKAWAVRVQSPVVAEITSPPLPADDVRRTVRNAVLMGVTPAPGATVELGEPHRSGGAYTIEVKASGRDCFEESTPVRVTLRTVPAPKRRAQEVLVSNAPERILEPVTLLRENLVGLAPVRLLWHHVNSSPTALRFAVRVVNRGTKTAKIHLTEAATGPMTDEIYVGHTAMARFVGLIQQSEGYMLSVPAGSMLELYDTRIQVGGIVSGLALITPVEAENLMLEVLAERSWPTTAYFAPVPERLLNDPPLTPYRFEAEKVVELEHEVGGAWTFYHVGKEYSTNLQGQKLYGDYGVNYTLKCTFRNPSDKPARGEMHLRASGGVARCTFLLNGNILETGMLRGLNEQILHKVDLAPGEQRSVTLITMPESGSNYPVTLTMMSRQ
ncbi:MAG: hypothetical protein ABFE07_20600 [Armatimonadia bacterium]